VIECDCPSSPKVWLMSCLAAKNLSVCFFHLVLPGSFWITRIPHLMSKLDPRNSLSTIRRMKEPSSSHRCLDWEACHQGCTAHYINVQLVAVRDCMARRKVKAVRKFRIGESRSHFKVITDKRKWRFVSQGHPAGWTSRTAEVEGVETGDGQRSDA